MNLVDMVNEPHEVSQHYADGFYYYVNEVKRMKDDVKRDLEKMRYSIGDYIDGTITLDELMGTLTYDMAHLQAETTRLAVMEQAKKDYNETLCLFDYTDYTED